ncbi:hypothetical protein KBY22_19345, partial [Ruegeria pomeroyi]|nr:hypothetical protein [Ruegeria pomeroyi]
TDDQSVETNQTAHISLQSSINVKQRETKNQHVAPNLFGANRVDLTSFFYFEVRGRGRSLRPTLPQQRR